MDSTPSAAVLARAAALAPGIAARAAEIEGLRRLPADLAAAMAAAGIFRLAVPLALGGLESDAATLLACIERLAAADGAAGWCAMIGATAALSAAWLPEPAARHIFADPLTITGGIFAPSGRLRHEAGGWRLCGRWTWGSGCETATWMFLGCRVTEPSTGVAAPPPCMAAVPRQDIIIHDTWHAVGLCGTGSHDVEVADAFVPEDRIFALTDPPRAPGPLYAFPVFGLLALGVAAVALGIAQAAEDELQRLAAVKTPVGSSRPLAARPTFQAELARAKAGRSAARALIFATVAEAAIEAAAGRPIGRERRAMLRLAASHATLQSVAAVDTAFRLAGGSAVHAASPLQRHLRDIHTASQHAMVAGSTFELAGRVLLGQPADDALL